MLGCGDQEIIALASGCLTFLSLLFFCNCNISTYNIIFRLNKMSIEEDLPYWSAVSSNENCLLH